MHLPAPSGFGSRMKFKSPTRVVDEMKYLSDLGYREIHFYDDNFSADMVRVAQICELILDRGIKLLVTSGGSAPWIGFALDAETDETRVLSNTYCVESGSVWVLTKTGKGTKKDQRETRCAGRKTRGWRLSATL